MPGWNRLAAKIRNLFRPAQAEDDLSREIASHVGLLEEDFARRGMTPAEARVAARQAYGNIAQVKELHREERSFLWIEQALHDIRYAFRSFLKSKVFAAVAMLTLALGIGANAAIFSIINTVLLHPLAYPQANLLVAVSANNLGSGINVVSYTKLTEIQAQSQTLEQVGAFYPVAMNLTINGAPEQLVGAHGSLDLFPLLGVSPALGRGFLPEEDQPGGKDVAMVTDAYWRDHFGADPNEIGKSISVDGRDTTVIGVLPASFRFPFFQPEPQIWLPRVFENPNYPPDRIPQGVAYLFPFAKMREGHPLARVQAELNTIAARYRQEFPNRADSAAGLTVASLESSLVANVKPSLLALLAAVGFVLLIACANVANLLLARATSREKEFGVRRALGAGRGRLIRQLLTESLVLSFLGGGLGVLLAALCLRPLMSIVKPGTIPLSDLVHLDRSVLLFSLAVCCITGLIFGLIPALQTSKRDLNEKLKEGGRGSTAGGGRIRQWMVVSEVALTLMLMTGAGLLIKSVVNLMNVSPGFVSGDVMTFFFSFPRAQYPRADQRREFCQRLLEQIHSIPGIQSAAVVSHLPLTGGTRFIYICPEGTACQGLGKDPISAWRQVSPAYFETMRTRLLYGRAFDDRDRSDSPPVVIINKTVADRYFPGTNPTGRHISNSRDRIALEIVGVAADVKFNALNAPNAEEVYVPYTQNTWQSMALVIRSGSAPVSAVRQIVARMDADLPLAQIQSMDQIVSASIAQPQLIAGLVGAFAATALFLAAVGIYGVMAYLVSQRSAEIAIRIALGAQRWTVFRLMVGQGMKLVIAGLALGVALSLAVTRLLSSLLFGTSPTDFWTIAGVSLLFTIVALAACYLPSRRAMRLDALAALRCM